VLRLQPVPVAVHQQPLPVLQPEDVGDPVRPLGGLGPPGEPDSEGLDVGGVGELGRDDRGQGPVADLAALELAAGPVPAAADLGPALLVAAPAVVPAERIDDAGILGGAVRAAALAR
jgi:hypothetical protein